MDMVIGYFRELFLELKLLINSIVDKELYMDALSKVAEESAQGFFLLGEIYEKGNSFVASDVGVAYAMYCLAAKKEVKTARVRALQLKLQMTSRDWLHVNRTLRNFNSDFRV